MHQERIYTYRLGEGPIADWDPRLKVALLLSYLTIVALLPRGGSTVAWLQYASLSGLLALTMIAGRVRFLPLLARSSIVLPFAAFLVLAEAFVVPGSADGAWGIPGTDSALGFSRAGAERAAAVLARAWMSILATLVLVTTTPVPRLLRALERFRMPRVLVLVVGLVHRYLWVVLEEARRLLTARRLRTFRDSRWPTRREGAALLATLFLRSLDRSVRIHQAMLLRGFCGQLPLSEDLRWSEDDSHRLLVGAAALLLSILLPLGWGSS